MRLHELSAVEVRRRLDAGELSSVALIDALELRAGQLNDALGALVVERWEALRREAAEADAERHAGRAHGPLHGMPVSVKECLDVVGMPTTLGFPAWKDRIATEDAAVVQALRAAGALILGKTNVPESLLSPLETTNPLWGTARNPWCTDRTPGGSSGGEAAALAAGISLLGVGTDVGGSIRIPAAFTGTAGLKPTVGRWSNRGSRSAISGQEFVRAQVGPMARTAEDLAFLYAALDPATMAAADPTLAPLRAADPATVRIEDLVVGVYESDGYLEPSPAVKRAVREAAHALEGLGARVVPYAPPNAEELLFAYIGAVSADGGRHIDRLLGGEAIIEPLKLVKFVADTPGPARAAMARAMQLAGEKRVARLLESVGLKNVDQYWSLTADRDRMVREEEAAWSKARLDAVLCPAQMTAAVPHGMGKDFILSFSYAARWNFLNRPAGVVPITCVRPGEEQRDVARDRLDKRARAVEEKSEGLPIGVQLVAAPWREDVCLALMAAVEHVAAAHPDFPKTPITPKGHSVPPPRPR